MFTPFATLPLFPPAGAVIMGFQYGCTSPEADSYFLNPSVMFVAVEMMQRTANENAACLRKICKRSDQPKIERLVNNDARVILRRKLNGATTR